MGAVEAEHVDEGRLALLPVLAGALAERVGGGLAVEDVVGDLEGRAERPPVADEIAPARPDRRGR